MTLHPIPLNFLIYEKKFIFFFIQVVTMLLKGILAGDSFLPLLRKQITILKFFDFISDLVSAAH
jgi:hypothetical protein